jgi:DNA-directed RNA polymerase subunit RPC12/RpoP
MNTVDELNTAVSRRALRVTSEECSICLGRPSNIPNGGQAMIELKCNNCGARLSAGEDEISMHEHGVTVKRDSSLRCEYCGAEYAPGDELSLAPSGVIQVSQQIGVVTGSVVGLSIDTLSGPKNREAKKKWWQFWK